MVPESVRIEAEKSVIDALEQAAFRGEWQYDQNGTALVAAIKTAEIVVAALIEEGWISGGVLMQSEHPQGTCEPGEGFKGDPGRDGFVCCHCGMTWLGYDMHGPWDDYEGDEVTDAETDQ